MNVYFWNVKYNSENESSGFIISESYEQAKEAILKDKASRWGEEWEGEFGTLTLIDPLNLLKSTQPWPLDEPNAKPNCLYEFNSLGMFAHIPSDRELKINDTAYYILRKGFIEALRCNHANITESAYVDLWNTLVQTFEMWFACGPFMDNYKDPFKHFNINIQDI